MYIILSYFNFQKYLRSKYFDSCNEFPPVLNKAHFNDRQFLLVDLDVILCKLMQNYTCLKINLTLAFSHVLQKMINGMTVSRWACINFSRSVQESVARGFCSELAQMCQVSGMVIFGLVLSWLFQLNVYSFSQPVI